MTSPELTRQAARLTGIAPSPIRAIFDRAAELEAAGNTIRHLEIGRPDFDTPEVAKQAAIEALRAGQVHYGPNPGTADLRTAIADYLEQRRGTRYRPDGEVIVTIGANEAVFLAVMALCGPGDEVVVPVPAWAHYQACVRLTGATPVELPLRAEDGYRLDPEALAGVLTERTRLVVLCSPSNPTGTVLDRNRLDAVADLLRPTGAVVLADEIYADLTYEGVEHQPVAAHSRLYPRTLSVGGFAKAFAMDGWRMGWLAGPAELVRPALRVRQYTTVCPPTFQQAGAAAALRHAGPAAEEMRREFERRRAAGLAVLADSPEIEVAPPDGAFYFYLRYPSDAAEPAESLTSRLLEEHHVAAVPGTAFDASGGTHALRVSYACSVDDLTEGLRRIVLAIGDRPHQNGTRP